MITRPAGSPFSEGDEVVLVKGSYEGTPGVFSRLKEDVNWADITERNGRIRSHPLIWLAHSAGVYEAATAEPEMKAKR
jgi:hypothetical protein